MENKYKYSTKNDPRNAEGYPENISPYQPTDAEKQTLIEMNADLQTGNTNLNIPYLELDNRTLQMAFYDFYRSFIGFTQTHASQDPESQWQSYLHKPYIMNKSQVFIGQAMANMVSPYWYAKNQNNEIAEMLHLSHHTILFHRANLRKKLGLRNKKVNLKAYLLSLPK